MQLHPFLHPLQVVASKTFFFWSPRVTYSAGRVTQFANKTGESHGREAGPSRFTSPAIKSRVISRWDSRYTGAVRANSRRPKFFFREAGVTALYIPAELVTLAVPTTMTTSLTTTRTLCFLRKCLSGIFVNGRKYFIHYTTSKESFVHFLTLLGINHRFRRKRLLRHLCANRWRSE